MIVSNTWQELALEALDAARIKTSVREFRKQCELIPPIPGKSYYDRERVAEELIEEGLIEVDEGILRLSRRASVNPPGWLMKGLEVGAPLSWKILEIFNLSEQSINKIDQSLLTQIGLEGELEVWRQLAVKLPAVTLNRMKHISLTDDSAGFDIYSPSVRNSDKTVLLEVKTTSRPGERFSFYISRNEARIASHNENWHLVGVIRYPEGYKILGHLGFDHFSQYLPKDTSLNGSWESAKIVVPVNIFIADFP